MRRAIIVAGFAAPSPAPPADTRSGLHPETQAAITDFELA
jgi:hypothetical protein